VASPAELESVLTHLDVADAAVIGVDSLEEATELPRWVCSILFLFSLYFCPVISSSFFLSSNPGSISPSYLIIPNVTPLLISRALLDHSFN
jgi:hypothetical protein